MVNGQKILGGMTLGKRDKEYNKFKFNTLYLSKSLK